MKVSILTPSFNQAQWLSDNLLSVRNQTYQNIEHIVMDGGSTDGSVDILEATDGVVWRSEPDRGQSHALNKAFEMSSGDIIGWLNSDDAYVDRRSVERVVEVFAKHPDVGVVYGDALLVSKSNQVMQYIWAPPHVQEFLNWNTFFVQPSVFIRRSVVQSPFVDEGLHFVMDKDLWWRLRDQTEFRRVPLVIAIDRHQPQRKTLQQAYPAEDRIHASTHGVDTVSRSFYLLSRSMKIGARIIGVGYIPTLKHRIESAISLQFPPSLQMMRQQLLTRRHRMDQS